jgi:putative nucleotidyltransferase with HDIG domain
MITSDIVRQRVRTLPSLPTTVISLGQAVADERCSVDRILNILAKDPALSATMLRLANSVMYAGDQRVMDLRNAVMRLGFEAILNLGRTAAIIRSFRGINHLDPFRLWQHSVAVGLVSKGICRLVKQNSMDESAYLAGLLHDIGKIALDRCFTDEYGPVVQAMERGDACLDAEFGHLGITHAEVGAMVAEHWSFPEAMVVAIRDHHQDHPVDFLPALIQVADLLVRTRIPNSPADEHLMFALEEQPAYSVVFGTSDLDAERLTFSIDDELEHAVAFVKLAFQD